ncbi:inosine monophosphate dehydrogenase [Sporormia fimetaria CBS 119925]|uniref:Inosine monophosphate dehydrogenase n=1 Tax=Sporormia fimetaria CBS 119925 TaxID=1340428 RepID=A0A6A6V232_9PLEO|nr:inosine monophosphate dehydrogenase [Sporormia fimetaria CBS 119925]
MAVLQKLKEDYPWIETPLVVAAPMRLITLAESVVEVTKAGGIAFLAAGTDPSDLPTHLQTARDLLTKHSSPIPSRPNHLPFGIGFINWGCELESCLPPITQFRPSAVWFFAPKSPSQLAQWSHETRAASPGTRIWAQVGSVQEAMDALEAAKPDVLVVQGTDAGGHGLARGAGIAVLVPEVCDAIDSYLASRSGIARPAIIAAGGITEARSAAAALVLGAHGVAMGTRFLASPEVNISRGYRDEVLRARDGGQSTVRTKVYDRLRGTTGWAENYNGRGVWNRSFVDAESGMKESENKRLYEEEMLKGDGGWGLEGRMTTYAGTGVGMVKEVQGAGDIVREVRDGMRRVLQNVGRTEKGRL